jgi:hypothetical protein
MVCVHGLRSGEWDENGERGRLEEGVFWAGKHVMAVL